MIWDIGCMLTFHPRCHYHWHATSKGQVPSLSINQLSESQCLTWGILLNSRKRAATKEDVEDVMSTDTNRHIQQRCECKCSFTMSSWFLTSINNQLICLQQLKSMIHPLSPMTKASLLMIQVTMHACHYQYSQWGTRDHIEIAAPTVTPIYI
jgi:hypothetical protein